MFKNKLTSDYQILTADGFVDFEGIRKSTDTKLLLQFVLEDKTKISVTPNHIFLIENQEIFAHSLIEGECLETADGLKRIKKIKCLKQKDYVYDILSVKSKKEEYFTNNIRSHNCRFIGSSSTLVEPDILEKIVTKDPILFKFQDRLFIYEEPKKGSLYYLGVDSAKGTGADFSCIQVIKIVDDFTIQQVAIFRDNRISTYNFAQICISVSEYYNNAQMMIESNGVGGEVLQSIWYEFEYEHVCNCDKVGLGINSNKQNKLSAVINLKEMIEEGFLTVVDQQTLQELSLFVEVSQNVFKCESDTAHDDSVTALMWGLYVMTTPYYDKKNTDVQKVDKQYLLTKKIEEEEDKPIMYFDDDARLGNFDEKEFNFL